MTMIWLEQIFNNETALLVYFSLIFFTIIATFIIIKVIWGILRNGTYLNEKNDHQKRLSIIDATPVDGRRRLILIKKDQTEHLVLIGGMNDLLIETNIQKKDFDLDTSGKSDQRQEISIPSKNVEPAITPTLSTIPPAQLKSSSGTPPRDNPPLEKNESEKASASKVQNNQKPNEIPDVKSEEESIKNQFSSDRLLNESDSAVKPAQHLKTSKSEHIDDEMEKLLNELTLKENGN